MSQTGANIERSIKAALQADPAITAIVARRVYTTLAPQKAVSPLLVLAVDSKGRKMRAGGGTIGEVQVSVDIAAWSKKSSNEARALGRQVRDIFIGRRYRLEGCSFIMTACTAGQSGWIDAAGFYADEVQLDGFYHVI